MEDKSYQTTGAIAFAIFTSSVAVVLRFMARRLGKASFGADDYTIVVGAVRTGTEILYLADSGSCLQSPTLWYTYGVRAPSTVKQHEVANAVLQPTSTATEGIYKRSNLKTSYFIGGSVTITVRSITLTLGVVMDFFRVVPAIRRSHHRDQGFHTPLLQESVFHSSISKVDLRRRCTRAGVASGKQPSICFSVRSYTKSLEAGLTWEVYQSTIYSQDCPGFQRDSGRLCVSFASGCGTSLALVNRKEN